MKHVMVEIIAWIRAAPVLINIWSRRGKRRLKWVFLWRYALRHPQWATGLGETISAAFPELRITFALFGEHGPEKDSRNPIWWEAPLTYTVWFQGHAACGMAVEFAGKRIDIRQLQGVKSFRTPKELSKWPERFVRSCIAFAETNDFTEVRLYRADQTIFYQYPLIDDPKPGLSRSETKKLVQQHMRRRYDGTARKLKMRMRKKYGVWVNPNYKGR